MILVRIGEADLLVDLPRILVRIGEADLLSGPSCVTGKARRNDLLIDLSMILVRIGEAAC